MEVQIFTKGNFFEMDAMHDCYASELSIDGKVLVITYNNLDEGPLDPNGEPIYKHKRLVIRYEFESYCDVIWHSKMRYDFIDFYKEPDSFYKMTKGYTFLNYKYSVDSFGELTLKLTAYKLKKNSYCYSRLYQIDILTDAKTITYTWE